MSLGIYIVGTPAVGSESKDVYCWCAHCRMRLQECILLVHPPYNASLEMYIAGVSTVRYEPRMYIASVPIVGR